MRKDALTSQTILGQLHTKSLDFKIIELHITSNVIRNINVSMSTTYLP